ncbi:hypothetical protein B0H14DRAFT_3170707 [Mycena olivaceomarginata]|nr:hypothetical protein B0H14DRAFT_3170707 [Mycena olivaceomarginata]
MLGPETPVRIALDGAAIPYVEFDCPILLRCARPLGKSRPKFAAERRSQGEESLPARMKSEDAVGTRERTFSSTVLVLARARKNNRGGDIPFQSPVDPQGIWNRLSRIDSELVGSGTQSTERKLGEKPVRSHRHWTVWRRRPACWWNDDNYLVGPRNIYTGSNGTGTFTQSYIATNKPAALLDSDGNIFGRTHPQYTHYAVNQFVSVRDQGAKGDGVTDDTAALQQIFAAFSGCKIVFFDGRHIHRHINSHHSCGNPNGRRGLVGNCGEGPSFKFGAPGSSGVLEITDIIFTTIGPAGGAIVVEWNVQQTTQGGAGMWDSHIRLGGAAGTNLQAADCPSDGSGVLKTHVQGTWVWLADHDLDEPEGGQDLVSIYSGRGILSESAGPASEHYVLYQYNLANAKSHYMGLIQTETPRGGTRKETIGQRVKGVTPFARVNLGRIA